MADIAIVRAAHLHLFVEEFRAIGVPVERELDRSRLPPWIERTPDAYISIPLALDWVARCSRDFEPMELGFRAAQRASLATLSTPLRRAIAGAPTGLQRLRVFLRFAVGDDSVLATGIHREGYRVRIHCDVAGFERNPFLCLAEWLNIQAMVSLMRSIAGPLWCPLEMSFVSARRPPLAAHEAFPDTRIVLGRPHTSILVDGDILARPCPVAGGARPNGHAPHWAATGEDSDPDWTFYTALQAAVRPYLADSYPRLDELAEILGISKRTLQRRLHRSGRTYSEAVEGARFDRARELLADPSAKIIDVAMSVGYANSQHFSRAFRRVAGIAPTTFRQSLLRQA